MNTLLVLYIFTGYFSNKLLIKGDSPWCTESCESDCAQTYCTLAAGVESCPDLCRHFGVTEDGLFCPFVTDCTQDKAKEICPITCAEGSQKVTQRLPNENQNNDKVTEQKPALINPGPTPPITAPEDVVDPGRMGKLNILGEPQKCDLIKCSLNEKDCSKTLEQRCQEKTTTSTTTVPPETTKLESNEEPPDCQRRKESIDCDNEQAEKLCPKTCNEINLAKRMAVTNRGSSTTFEIMGILKYITWIPVIPLYRQRLE